MLRTSGARENNDVGMRFELIIRTTHTAELTTRPMTDTISRFFCDVFVFYEKRLLTKMACARTRVA